MDDSPSHRSPCFDLAERVSLYQAGGTPIGDGAAPKRYCSTGSSKRDPCAGCPRSTSSAGRKPTSGTSPRTNDRSFTSVRRAVSPAGSVSWARWRGERARAAAGTRHPRVAGPETSVDLPLPKWTLLGDSPNRNSMGMSPRAGMALGSVRSGTHLVAARPEAVSQAVQPHCRDLPHVRGRRLSGVLRRDAKAPRRAFSDWMSVSSSVSRVKNVSVTETDGASPFRTQ